MAIAVIVNFKNFLAFRDLFALGKLKATIEFFFPNFVCVQKLNDQPNSPPSSTTISQLTQSIDMMPIQ